MITKILRKLDDWMLKENAARNEAGTLGLGRAKLQILDQMALIEAKVELELIATMDLDAFIKAEYAVTQQLEKLLAEHGLRLDQDSKLIWMPEETKYEHFFAGKMLDAELALPEYVILSKALKAPKKNMALMTEYLASGASANFQKLAEKYNLDLEQFL